MPAVSAAMHANFRPGSFGHLLIPFNFSPLRRNITPSLPPHLCPKRVGNFHISLRLHVCLAPAFTARSLSSGIDKEKKAFSPPSIQGKFISISFLHLGVHQRPPDSQLLEPRASPLLLSGVTAGELGFFFFHGTKLLLDMRPPQKLVGREAFFSPLTPVRPAKSSFGPPLFLHKPQTIKSFTSRDAECPFFHLSYVLLPSPTFLARSAVHPSESKRMRFPFFLSLVALLCVGELSPPATTISFLHDGLLTPLLFMAVTGSTFWPTLDSFLFFPKVRSKWDPQFCSSPRKRPPPYHPNEHGPPFFKMVSRQFAVRFCAQWEVIPFLKIELFFFVDGVDPHANVI